MHTGTSSTAAEVSSSAGFDLATEIFPSHWRSLRAFNLYRLVVAGLFVFLSLGKLSDWPYDYDSQSTFRGAALLYFGLSLVFLVLIRQRAPGFRTQLSLHIFTDIVLVTALTSASGGLPSGLGLLLLVPLASAGLVGQGRMALMYAALASMAMLALHTLRILEWQAEPRDYLQTALLCLSFFAVASLAHLLTRRAMLSEKAAADHGRELALINRIHALATGDSTDGILATDTDGRLIYCNLQARKLLGLREEQSCVTLAEASPELEQRRQSWQDDLGPTTAMMPEKLIRARFLPLDNERRTLVLLEDPARAEALAQQMKLAALGRLTLNIAHEIRNPLSAIGHAAQLLSEEETDPANVKLSGIIQNNVYRLDRMVQDILTLNRRDRQSREKIQLQSFVQLWLEEWRNAEELPQNAVIVRMEPEICVEFAPQHLYQILWNLASNAWRHSHKQAGSLHITLLQAGQDASLEIRDDGSGISAAQQSRLFEPFQTTDPKGTGLGLYIARELAEANSAQLNYVGNDPGAVFRLNFQVHPC